jgi:hypothetical protein
MASNIQNHTQGEATRDLLDRLCAQIETAWQERQDPSEVDCVAREHPNLAAELYDFFASLMETELDPHQDDEECGPDPLVKRWLEEEGYTLALRAAQEECRDTATSVTATAEVGASVPSGTPPPTPQGSTAGKVVAIRSYVRLLQERAGATPVEVAEKTDTPLEFIMFAQQNQEPRYDRLRGEIVNRGVESYDIKYEEGAHAIRQRLPWAAFAGTTTTKKSSFKELVAKSRLAKAKKNLWLSLVDDEDT